MKALLVTSLAAFLLSGCVVAPIGTALRLRRWRRGCRGTAGSGQTVLPAVPLFDSCQHSGAYE